MYLGWWPASRAGPLVSVSHTVAGAGANVATYAAFYMRAGDLNLCPPCLCSAGSYLVSRHLPGLSNDLTTPNW